jgi:hypothetical protein
MSNGTDRVISLDVKKRVKLTGAELEEYRRKKDKEKHFRLVLKLVHYRHTYNSTIFNLKTFQ